MGKVGLHKEGASGCSGSYTAYIILPQIDDVQCFNDTPPVQKRAQLTTVTTRSGSLKYVSAAEHHTAAHDAKTDRTKPRKHLQEAIYHEILAKTSPR